MISISLSGDLVTWTNSFSNGTPIKEVIEEPKLSIRENLKLGVQSTNSLKLTVSGLVAYCHEFVSGSNKFIRFGHDGNVSFIGILSTYNTKFDDGEVATLSLTYKDLTEVWKDEVFCTDPREALSYGDRYAKDVGTYHDKQLVLKILRDEATRLLNAYNEGAWKGNGKIYNQYVDVMNKIDDINNDRGTGEYDWEATVIDADGYKVLDFSNPSKSLVHWIINYLPHHEKLTISGIASVTTLVTAFKVKGSDQVLSVLSSVCEQNGLAISLNGLELRIFNLYEQKGTASTVRRIEAEATLTDKPYIEKTFPNIRWCSNAKTVNYGYDGVKMNSEVFSLKSSDDIEKGKTYPVDGTYIELEFKPSVPNNAEIFDVRLSNWYANITSFSFTIPFPKTSDLNLQVVSTKAFGNRAFCIIKNPSNRIKAKAWYVYAYGSVTYVEYSQVVESLYTNHDEQTYKYIYNADDARKFDCVRRWQKDADSKFYTFYADEDLNLGDLITLSGIEDKALIVTSKTDRLDPFGGYTYTASEVIDSAEVSFDENHQAVNLELPTASAGFTLTATRSLIPCGFDGQPSDSTPIRITCVVDSLLSTPTCEVDGEPVQLTEEYDQIGEDLMATGRWHIDVDPYLTGYAQQTYEFTVGGKTESVTLRKVATSKTEAQYAIGTDPENPPVQEAKWNGEVCTWNGEVCTWDEGLWDEKPSQPARGEYLWMRTRSRA